MKGRTRILAVAAIFVAVLSMSGTAHAWPPVSLSGAMVQNDIGDTITITAALNGTSSGTTWTGTGTGGLIYNGEPLNIVCMWWHGDTASNYWEFYITAASRPLDDPLGTHLDFIRIVLGGSFYGNQQLFGHGNPIPLPSPCQADVNVYPLTSTSPLFV